MGSGRARLGVQGILNRALHLLGRSGNTAHLSRGDRHVIAHQIARAIGGHVARLQAAELIEAIGIGHHGNRARLGAVRSAKRLVQLPMINALVDGCRHRVINCGGRHPQPLTQHDLLVRITRLGRAQQSVIVAVAPYRTGNHLLRRGKLAHIAAGHTLNRRAVISKQALLHRQPIVGHARQAAEQAAICRKRLGRGKLNLRIMRSSILRLHVSQNHLTVVSAVRIVFLAHDAQSGVRTRSTRSTLNGIGHVGVNRVSRLAAFVAQRQHPVVVSQTVNGGLHLHAGHRQAISRQIMRAISRRISRRQALEHIHAQLACLGGRVVLRRQRGKLARSTGNCSVAVAAISNRSRQIARISIGAEGSVLNPTALALINVIRCRIIGIRGGNPVPLGQAHLLASQANLGARALACQLLNAVVVGIIPHQALNLGRGQVQQARIPILNALGIRQVVRNLLGALLDGNAVVVQTLAYHRLTRHDNHGIGTNAGIKLASTRLVQITHVGRAVIGRAQHRIKIGVKGIVCLVSQRNCPLACGKLRLGKVDAITRKVACLLIVRNIRAGIRVNHIRCHIFEQVLANRRGARGLHGQRATLPCALTAISLGVPPILLQANLHIGNALLVDILEAVAINVVPNEVANVALRAVNPAKSNLVAVLEAQVRLGRVLVYGNAVGINRDNCLERTRESLLARHEQVVIVNGHATRRVSQRVVRPVVQGRLQHAVLRCIRALNHIRALGNQLERKRAILIGHHGGRLVIGIHSLRHLARGGIVFIHRHAHIGQTVLSRSRARVGGIRVQPVHALRIHDAVDVVRQLGRAVRQQVIAEHRALIGDRARDAHVVAGSLGIIRRVDRIVLACGKGVLVILHSLNGNGLGRGDHQRRLVDGGGGGIILHMLGNHGNAIPANFLSGQRIGRILAGERVAQLVLARLQVGEDVVTLVAVVIALGGEHVRLIGQRVVAIRRQIRVAVLIGQNPLRHVVRQVVANLHDTLSVARSGHAVLVKQLDNHAVDTGILSHAVIVDVLEQVSRHLIAIVKTGPNTRLGIDVFAGGKQPAAVVGQVIRGIAAQAVLRQGTLGIVLQGIPVRVNPHVIANVATLVRRAHEHAGPRRLLEVGVGILTCIGATTIDAVKHRVPLNDLVQAVSKAAAGLGVQVHCGITRKRARVLRKVQRGVHVVNQADVARSRQVNAVVGYLSPNGTKGLLQGLCLIGMRRHVRLKLLQLNHVGALKHIAASVRVMVALVHPGKLLNVLALLVKTRERGFCQRRDAAIGILLVGTNPYSVVGSRKLRAVRSGHVARVIGDELDGIKILDPTVPLRITGIAHALAAARRLNIAVVRQDVEQQRTHVVLRPLIRIAQVHGRGIVRVIRALRRLCGVIDVVRAGHKRVNLRGDVLRLRRDGVLDKREGRQLHHEHLLVVLAVQVDVTIVANKVDGLRGVLLLRHVAVEVARLVAIGGSTQQVAADGGVGVLADGHHELDDHGLALLQTTQAALGALEAPVKVLALRGVVSVTLVLCQEITADIRIGNARGGVGVVGKDLLATQLIVVADNVVRPRRRNGIQVLRRRHHRRRHNLLHHRIAVLIQNGIAILVQNFLHNRVAAQIEQRVKPGNGVGVVIDV